MQTHQELVRRFGNEKGVELSEVNGLTKIVLRSGSVMCELFQQGAHVSQAVNRDGTPLLYLSDKSLFRPGKAIRGGIPLIFPWFGPDRQNASNPQHGFVRAAIWNVDELHAADAKGVSAVLSFHDDDETRKYRGFAFTATYRVELDEELRLTLSVRNHSDQPFEFEEALHTYLPVSDIHRVRIEGLSGAEYIDKTDSMQRKQAPQGDLMIEKETDSVFEGSDSAVRVRDQELGQLLIVEKSHSHSTIVWNPWAEKGSGLADLGEGWKGMICIESANVGANAVTLGPGQSHELKATIRAQKL